METYFWIFWTVLGAVLIIAEIFTTGFVLLWFGIGALAAAFAAFIGINSITAQFLIFAIISIALTAASRMARWTSPPSPEGQPPRARA